jgi:hypothetical protein
MQKPEAGRSVEETAGTSKPRKSQSLRLDKQTIRTLTGAELKLVGGGVTTVGVCRPCNTTHTVP